MSKIIKAIILAGILIPICSASYAKMVDGISFESAYNDEGRVMDLQGIGVKKFVFMKIFVAGFYLDKDVDTENVLDDVSKRIQITYFRPVTGKRLAKYIRERMKISMTESEFEKVTDRIDRMDQFYVDLKPGDIFSMSYVPDRGTKFEFNSNLLGIIEGADFGKGIFSTWIGDEPFDKSVRRQVLGLDE